MFGVLEMADGGISNGFPVSCGVELVAGAIVLRMWDTFVTFFLLVFERSSISAFPK